MEIKKFVKDHKKEFIIGGVVIAGVATAIYVYKTKKTVADDDFLKIATNLVKQWQDKGCSQMTEAACLLSDLDRYAVLVQEDNPDLLNNAVELIIGFAPSNARMSIKPAAANLIELSPRA